MSPRTRRWSWPTMGSTASLAIPTVAPAAEDAAVRAVREWLEQVEAVLSPHRPDSDLCRWRSGEIPLARCSPLLSEVVTDVDNLRRLTDDGFHPHDRRGLYDPTGYVKGWAVQRAVGILLGAGVADAALGVGGDIQTIGRAPGGRPWRVAISDPADSGRILAIVRAYDNPPFAVATSGTSQRGDHIWSAWDRPDGTQPTHSPWASITVVGPLLGVADAFATAIWAHCRHLPLEQAWTWLAGTGYEALAIDDSGRTRATTRMADRLVQPGSPITC